MNTIPKATDINSVVKTHKAISKISIFALALVSITFFVLYTLKDQEKDKRAYFVFPNNVYEGEAQSTGLINYYMAKDHIRKFIGLMFSHDEKTFKSRVEGAMDLIEKEEGKALYFQFKQGKVFETYVNYRSRTRVEIDSISLDMQKVPVQGVAYFKQITVLPEPPEFIQPIAFSFTLEPTSFQNEVNSAGLMIRNFKIKTYELPSDDLNNSLVPTAEPLKNTDEVTQ